VRREAESNYVSLDVLLVNLHSVRNKWVLHPPLGLCYLGAMLEREGFSVQILDANSPPELPGQLLLDEIERIGPAIVGFTLFTPDLGTFGELMPGLRKLIAKGTIGHLVLGGHHPSYQPEIVRDIAIRWGVMWDGEAAFPELCKTLLREGGTDPTDIPGVISNLGGKFHVNEHRLTPDLNELPYPARHLIDNDAYFNPISSRKISSLIMARGCPFECSFCSGATETSKLRMRYRHVDNVMGELREIRNTYGIDYVEFVDETFTLNKRLINDLCDAMIDEGLDIKWGCQTRADVVEPQLMKKMADAGCDKVSFGIDASTERMRMSVVGKRITDKEFRDAFKWVHDAGIKSVANIIFGFPGEREYEVHRTLTLVRSLRPTFANFQPLYIYPATEIYARALEEGKISENYWRRMVDEKLDMVPVYEQPEFGLDASRLKAFGRSFIWRFYLQPSQIAKLLERDHAPSDVMNYARIAAGMYRYYFREAAA
jgi:anaerobic magnesium-protoporphyrin IX monomethyl ester cyclase